MTTLLPCNTCWFRTSGDCPERIIRRAHAKGTGFTTLRFVCERQKVEYRPGRQVKARIQGGGENCWDEGHVTVIVPATVLYKTRGRDRWVVWPDDDQHEKLPGVRSNELKLCALRSENLEPLSEPDRPERVAELSERDARMVMKGMEI